MEKGTLQSLQGPSKRLAPPNLRGNISLWLMIGRQALA